MSDVLILPYRTPRDYCASLLHELDDAPPATCFASVSLTRGIVATVDLCDACAAEVTA